MQSQTVPLGTLNLELSHDVQFIVVVKQVLQEYKHGKQVSYKLSKYLSIH